MFYYLHTPQNVIHLGTLSVEVYSYIPHYRGSIDSVGKYQNNIRSRSHCNRKIVQFKFILLAITSPSLWLLRYFISNCMLAILQFYITKVIRFGQEDKWVHYGLQLVTAATVVQTWIYCHSVVRTRNLFVVLKYESAKRHIYYRVLLLHFSFF